MKNAKYLLLLVIFSNCRIGLEVDNIQIEKRLNSSTAIAKHDTLQGLFMLVYSYEQDNARPGKPICPYKSDRWLYYNGNISKIYYTKDYTILLDSTKNNRKRFFFIEFDSYSITDAKYSKKLKHLKLDKMLNQMDSVSVIKYR